MTCKINQLYGINFVRNTADFWVEDNPKDKTMITDKGWEISNACSSCVLWHRLPMDKVVGESIAYTCFF